MKVSNDEKIESNDIELLILGAAINSEEYSRKCIPHIQQEFFDQQSNKTLYTIISDYVAKYNKIPNQSALTIELEDIDNIPDQVFSSATSTIGKLFSNSMVNAVENASIQWLIDKTENYCLYRSSCNGIAESIKIIDGSGSDPTMSKDAIPGILQDALSVSFNTNIGHDYFSDAAARFDFYQREDTRLDLPIKMMNKITGGGLPRKSMTVMVAPTGVGKTYMLCALGSHFLMQGLNVVYFTMEMSEEQIGQRFDANLFDVDMNQVEMYPKKNFMSKIDKLKGKTAGSLILQQYAPVTAGASTFRFFLDELKMKKKMTPDVILVDYLNICSSSRFKARENSYGYVKSIAEEIRGLAIEYDAVVCTAAQSNREGQNATDFDLNEVADSHGLSMTADMIWGIIGTEELEKQNRLRIKQLKNRFNSIIPKSFMIGTNRSKMQIFDVDDMQNQNNGPIAPPPTLVKGKGSVQQPKGQFKFD